MYNNLPRYIKKSICFQIKRCTLADSRGRWGCGILGHFFYFVQFLRINGENNILAHLFWRWSPSSHLGNFGCATEVVISGFNGTWCFGSILQRYQFFSFSLGFWNYLATNTVDEKCVKDKILTQQIGCATTIGVFQMDSCENNVSQ